MALLAEQIESVLGFGIAWANILLHPRRNLPYFRRSLAECYGRPIMMQELATAPTNEAGVLFLFGALAKQLGFMVLRLQADFPDCLALRMGPDGKWRMVRIELEFESRNFLLHGHDPNGCDLIVCWTHNWPSCPIEVLELEKLTADLRG